MVWRTRILQPEDDPILSKFPTLDEASGIYIPIELPILYNSQRRPSIDTYPSISIDDRRGLEDYSQSILSAWDVLILTSVADKFFEFTKPVMDSFLTNSADAEFPFDTSPEEIEVIKHRDSGTLIMGRSGTGKTTCLVQKLVRNYTARKLIIGQAPPRQVSRTVSLKCPSLLIRIRRIDSPHPLKASRREA